MSAGRRPFAEASTQSRVGVNSRHKVRRVWEVLLGVFVTALGLFISASLPQASIQRDSGAAVVSLALALIVVIVYESRTESSRDDGNTSECLAVQNEARELAAELRGWYAGHQARQPVLGDFSEGWQQRLTQHSTNFVDEYRIRYRAR